MGNSYSFSGTWAACEDGTGRDGWVGGGQWGCLGDSLEEHMACWSRPWFADTACKGQATHPSHKHTFRYLRKDSSSGSSMSSARPRPLRPRAVLQEDREGATANASEQKSIVVSTGLNWCKVLLKGWWMQGLCTGGRRYF